MSPLSVIAVPLALIIIGIVLNSIHIVHDQPAYSLENDPAINWQPNGSRTAGELSLFLSTETESADVETPEEDGTAVRNFSHDG